MKRPPKLGKIDPNIDASDWWTRQEVVQFAGIGASTVIAYERRGVLRPRRVYRCDTRGAERVTLVYDPAEVLKLPRRERVSIGRSDGETTARAFELFREGKTHEEVIIELRLTFDRTEELHEKWLYATSASRVIAPVAWEALEQLVGPFGTVTDLIERLAKQLKPDLGEKQTAFPDEPPTPSIA